MRVSSEAAVAGGQGAPRGERRGRRVDRSVHVLGAAARDGSEHLAARGVLDLDAPAACGARPLAADQHPGLGKAFGDLRGQELRTRS